MSFPRYPAYKPSGVEWLGEVPEHWAISRLKQVVEDERRITYGIVQAGPHIPEGVPYVRPADMTDECGVSSPGEILRTSIDIASGYARSSLRPGDIVCSIGPSFGKVMIVPNWLDGANLTQGTARVSIGKKAVPRFIFWCLRSKPSNDQWESSVGGATFRALNLGPLAETFLALPAKAEQASIATFLDRETAKIDALIAEQQRLIELLQEKRQAVISHAVTKGLNPDAPMKDSGVEWLGEVPEHWEVAPIKHHWLVTDCKHVTAEFTEDGHPLASIREVQGRWVSLEMAKRTTEDFYQLLTEGNRNPEPGDLVFSRNATVGEVAEVPENAEPFALGQDVVLLKRQNKSHSSSYEWHLLRSTAVVSQLECAMIGSTFRRINVEQIKALSTPVPPPGEQVLIAAHLESISDNLARQANDAYACVSLLQERRSALISAAVTGQIDVRGLVAEAEAA